MATITVSAQDLTAADTYLATYLSEKIPEADFSQGSAIRDFVVKAIAHVFAYFRAEIQTSRDRQSILALQQLPGGDDVDEAVDALLSNLFIKRKTGLRSRVVATLHFTSRVDVVIQPAIRFFREGQAFTIDQTDVLFIPAANLRAVQLSTSSALEYVTTVTLVASAEGAAGNVTPGRFSGSDRFSAFFAYAENLDYGLGGKGTETTADLLARAPTSLAVRNLANVRSVQAVLLDEFPELTQVFTAGFGDPEMTRDRTSEGVTQIDMHVGGHMDVYVKLPTVTVTEDLLEVGAAFTRADGVVNTFQDSTVDFTSSPAVVPGDVLKIQAGIPGAPREFIINSVSSQLLTIADRASFPVEASGITYTIGSVAPLYADKRSGSSSGQTTNLIQEMNAVFLPGRPKGKLRKVELSADPGGPWVDLERVNVLAPTTGQYTVVNVTPSLAQSSLAVEKLVVADGHNANFVRVTYDTLAGFDTVSARVTDAFERNICANNLVRGFVPVYVAVIGKYALTPGSTAIDDGALKQALAEFIYGWDSNEALDVSAITSYLREKFPTINRFYAPTTIFFTVYAPDGQLYEFQTTDVVEVFPDGVASVSLRGAGAHAMRDETVLGGLRFPGSTAFNGALLALQGIFADAGITSRNVRFFPDTDTTVITPYID